MLRIALFHPWIKSKGGAERVVLEFLKNTKYDVDIYTWVYDKENTFEDFKRYPIRIIAPNFMRKISRSYLLRGLSFLFIAFFSKIPLKKYDVFLISTSGLAEFLTFRNYKKNKTFLYVHTPLRAAQEEDIKQNLENIYATPVKKVIYYFAIKVYRIFEKLAWKRVSCVIFNSELTEERVRSRNLIKDIESYIVYPPVDIPKKNKRINDRKYLLYVSRLNPPKRQDVLIKAWNKIRTNFPDYKLILVGNIDNKNYYKKIIDNTNESIEIKSNVSAEELDKLYRNCSAGIFLGYKEDFGIVPLEVLSYGKPLLAPNVGGYFNLIKQNPLFIKLQEKHSNKKMVEEVAKKIKYFLKNKDKIKNKTKNKVKINYPDSKTFTNKIEEILR